MNITADFTRSAGAVKPMHGVGQPPFYYEDFTLFRYLRDAGVPYSRLHDVGGWLGGGLYVDIPNLFRDFDADENDPASYDFAFTDRLLKGLCDYGIEPFFRLGVTIENSWDLRSYRVFPPKDPAKWARICEHIIRHYNEGWADGHHMGITYWEIWNEPDGGANMWQGTKEQYFELYEITAKHLKACFGSSIKVGGYAAVGFYSWHRDPEGTGDIQYTENAAPGIQKSESFLTWAHDFFKWITSGEHRAPIDFFSWHSYSKVHDAVNQARYVRRMMNHYGLENVPDILDEWNTVHERYGRAEPRSASEALAFMLAMQNESVSEMNYYDARLGASQYGGLFNPSTWEPYIGYYAFAAFGAAYKLGGACVSASDDKNVFTLAAADGKKSVLLVANVGPETTAELSLCGVDLSDAYVIRIDGHHSYTPTGESLADGKLFLPKDSCVEIHF